ncbi:hypothetical protein [Algoriphagus sp. AK58]|uniref:hypothetical protein n=1 Tax=Algoriphagus sp. AK58 TaxID=1406877 RepID=UPI00164F047F|nr:hypothetical protein [Algoriphagus sp. AK58]MBC6368186.1 hypothetical protein [Algoriphagus sp. AK58]
MLKNAVIALLIFFAIQSKVYAQSTFNLSFGFPKINWGYSGNLDGLRTVNTSGWSITASGLKIKEDGLIYGIDLGVNRYGNGFQYGISRPGVGEIHHFSILPLIGYNHIIPGSKFSFRLNFAFGAGIVTLADRYYQNDHSFKVMFTSYGVPLYDLTFSGSQEVKSRVFPLLKPSLELHYAVGERSTLFVKGTLGISLMNSVIVRDFPEVLLDGETYSVTHSTSLSYSSVEIGYSYRIK